MRGESKIRSEIIDVYTIIDGEFESIRGYRLVASRDMRVEVCPRGTRASRKDLAELLRLTDNHNDVIIRIEFDKKRVIYVGKVYMKD